MAANNFNNWDNGFPYNGIEPATTNSMSFWDNGFPFQFIDSTSGGAPAIQKAWGFIIG
ncbi:MAG: hypothetical protein IPG21_04640 [Saprospiraceae bacterium]|jgi:hypothetical protein|nr:hypothetical protein [Candidatus Vicinibacter affinis]